MEGTEQEREDGESCAERGLMHVAGKDEGSKPGAGPATLPLASAPDVCSEPKSVTLGTATVSHGAMNIFPAPLISCSVLLPPANWAKQENPAETKLGKGTAMEQTRVTVSLSAAGLRLSKISNR